MRKLWVFIRSVLILAVAVIVLNLLSTLYFGMRLGYYFQSITKGDGLELQVVGDGFFSKTVNVSYAGLPPVRYTVYPGVFSIPRLWAGHYAPMMYYFELEHPVTLKNKEIHINIDQVDGTVSLSKHLELHAHLSDLTYVSLDQRTFLDLKHLDIYDHWNIMAKDLAVVNKEAQTTFTIKTISSHNQVAHFSDARLVDEKHHATFHLDDASINVRPLVFHTDDGKEACNINATINIVNLVLNQQPLLNAQMTIRAKNIPITPAQSAAELVATYKSIDNWVLLHSGLGVKLDVQTEGGDSSLMLDLSLGDAYNPLVARYIQSANFTMDLNIYTVEYIVEQLASLTTYPFKPEALIQEMEKNFNIYISKGLLQRKGNVYHTEVHYNNGRFDVNNLKNKAIQELGL